MPDEAAVLAAEHEFFQALMSARPTELDRILSDDFTLVALDGSVISKPGLMEAVGSGQLRFHGIDPMEASVRFCDNTAIVVGRTEMRGRAGETEFTFSSRYTHVFAERSGRLQLAAAQGTPIQAR